MPLTEYADSYIRASVRDPDAAEQLLQALRRLQPESPLVFDISTWGFTAIMDKSRVLPPPRPIYLTDSTGGTASSILSALATIITITDSTGLHATHNDTLVSGVVADGDMTGLADGSFESVGDTSAGDVSGAIMNNFKEVQAAISALTQNDSDLGQKIIELVSVLTTVKNNYASLAAHVNALVADLEATKAYLSAQGYALQAAGILGRPSILENA